MMVMDQFPGILKAPGSDVIIDKLWDNGILLIARYWIPVSDNYITTKSNITETFKNYGTLKIKNQKFFNEIIFENIFSAAIFD